MTARRDHLLKLVAAVAVAGLLLGMAVPGMPPSRQAPIDPALVPGDFALVAVAHGAAPRVARLAQDAGATETSTLDAIDLVTARVSAPTLAALRSDPAVRLIAADGGVSASGRRKNVDVPGENSVGVLAIDAEKAWRSSTGRGVTVALLDTGIANHPALSGSVVASVDFVNDGAKVLDPGGHGTHLAGLIAGHSAEFRGVAPDAKLVSLRVLDAHGDGTVHGVLGAIDWTLKHRREFGIRVMNLSFGATQRTSYQSDILAAAAESVWFSGVVVVAAAGNDGPQDGTIGTPGADPFVVTVGSLDDHGTVQAADDRESSFSSRGPTRDGFAKPDVLAPGERVLSLRVRGSALDQSVPGVSLGTPPLYERMTGTSVSSAMVSGIAALVLADRSSYTPTQVKGAIVAGSRRVNGSHTPGADAAQALTAHPDRVNVGLKPSRLLVEMLARNGVSIASVSWEGISWEAVSWEAVSWEGVAWEGVNWESVAWESRR
jgi:serine protease AprX